jgi:hypothetical protein
MYEAQNEMKLDYWFKFVNLKKWVLMDVINIEIEIKI